MDEFLEDLVNRVGRDRPVKLTINVGACQDEDDDDEEDLDEDDLDEEDESDDDQDEENENA